MERPDLDLNRIRAQLAGLHDGAHATTYGDSYECLARSGPYRWAVQLHPGHLPPGSLASLAPRTLVVVDSGAWDHHAPTIRAAVTGATDNARRPIEVLPGGESGKTGETAEQIVTAMEDHGIGRDGLLIAVGGGALLDVAGYAASQLRRGVHWVRVGTTLVAQADAMVGLKTAINKNGKNRWGTYHPAILSLGYSGFLATTGPDSIRCGVAEIAKMALCQPGRLWGELLRLSAELLRPSVVAGLPLRDAVTGMVSSLTANPLETDPARDVDLAHTFAHTIELTAGIPHGYAVGIDLASMAGVAVNRGLLGPATHTDLLGLLRAVGLPVVHPALTLDLVRAALDDLIKQRRGQQWVPLPVEGGGVTWVHDLTAEEVMAAVDANREAQSLAH